MRIMFHKKDLYGMWFDDGETSDMFTEKIPPDAAHVWDEESGEWALPEPEAVPETGCGELGGAECEKPALPDAPQGEI